MELRFTNSKKEGVDLNTALKALGCGFLIEANSVPEGISLLVDGFNEQKSISILDVLDSSVVIERFGSIFNIVLSTNKRNVVVVFEMFNDQAKISDLEFSNNDWLSIIKTIESQNKVGSEQATLYMLGVLDILLQTAKINGTQHAYWCNKLNV